MKITIEGKSGKVEVDAIETDTPGLVIADTPLWTGKIEYSVTHQASGLAIGPSVKTKKQAKRIVRELDGLTDWTQSDEELKGVAGLNQRVKDVLAVLA